MADLQDAYCSCPNIGTMRHAPWPSFERREELCEHVVFSLHLDRGSEGRSAHPAENYLRLYPLRANVFSSSDVTALCWTLNTIRSVNSDGRSRLSA